MNCKVLPGGRKESFSRLRKRKRRRARVLRRLTRGFLSFSMLTAVRQLGNRRLIVLDNKHSYQSYIGVGSLAFLGNIIRNRKVE